MLEPLCLQRGKAFHRLVQTDWLANVGGLTVEHPISRALPIANARRLRRGRLDIFIDSENTDFVVVIEIKSTDWDQVNPKYRRKLLAAHCRQVWRYIEKYLDDDDVSVCAAMIYPAPPATVALRDEIEQFLGNNAIQISWFSEG